MNWLAPLAGLPKGRSFDRHRPGYFRDWYWRNVEKRRAYLSTWNKERRRRLRAPAEAMSQFK